MASHAANDTCGILSLSDTTIDPPKVIYKNGDDPKEVELCLPFSLANGLHYLGFHLQGMAVLLCNVQGLRNLGLDLKDNDGCPIWSTRVYHGEDRHSPLNGSHCTPNPVVAVLEGMLTRETLEGPITTLLNRCVCFVGDWLFDINQDAAHKIFRKTLDQVTDLALPGSAFSSTVVAREFKVIDRKAQLQRKSSREWAS